MIIPILLICSILAIINVAGIVLIIIALIKYKKNYRDSFICFLEQVKMIIVADIVLISTLLILICFDLLLKLFSII